MRMLRSLKKFPLPLVILAALAIGGGAYSAKLSAAPIAQRAPTPRGPLFADEQAQIDLFEKASASVVVVVATTVNSSSLFFDLEGNGGRSVQTGTGFIWDAAGHIVTNNHVVANSRSVPVRLASGEIVKAEVIGTAPAYY